MNATRTVEETRKSTSVTKTAENGKISRGKYTFVTSVLLAVNEVTANRSADEKKFHAIRPLNANSGYGIPVSRGATREKMTEKITVLMSGMNTAQPNPITVCL